MRERAKVSVIIPTYNSVGYVTDAVESVLAQTYSELEVIVVDDGSTDETGEALKKYGAAIDYHYKSNGGVSSARNYGIERATGKYVAFLDADDLWMPEKIEKQVALLENSGRGRACYSAFALFEYNLDEVSVRRSERFANTLEDLLLHGNVVGTPSSVVAEKKLFEQVGGFDPALSLCADWEMWIRLATRTEFVYLDEPLLKYRIHDSNMSNNAPLLESDTLALLKKAFSLSDIPEAVVKKKDKVYAKNYMIFAGAYFQADKYKDFLRCVRHSLKFDFGQIEYLLKFPVRSITRRLGTNS